MTKRSPILAVILLLIGPVLSPLLSPATRVFAQDTAAPAETSSPSASPAYEPYKPAPEGSGSASGGGGGGGGGSTIKDTSAHRRPMTLSGLAYVPWWYGIGIGMSVGFEIPIMHDGFIPSLNDSFSIEPSFGFAYLDYYYYGNVDNDYALMFRPAVGALWSFYLKPNLRVYGIINFGYTRINRYYDEASTSLKYGYNYFYGEAGAGVIWNFAEKWAVRGELAFHGLRGGINYSF
jgi:hypothetical protein